MIYGVYSVFDSAVELYLQPFFMRTDREAVRAVSTVLADANHQFARSPEEYVLFTLGVFEEATGRFVQTEHEPSRMVTLLQLKAKGEQ